MEPPVRAGQSYRLRPVPGGLFQLEERLLRLLPAGCVSAVPRYAQVRLRLEGHVLVSYLLCCHFSFFLQLLGSVFLVCAFFFH